jgi:hypothetical protein
VADGMRRRRATTSGKGGGFSGDGRSTMLYFYIDEVPHQSCASRPPRCSSCHSASSASSPPSTSSANYTSPAPLQPPCDPIALASSYWISTKSDGIYDELCMTRRPSCHGHCVA